MDVFSPKERLLKTLKKEAVDRPPVICPGGMMNSAIIEIMEKTGHLLPPAHHTGRLMSDLASDVYTHTGFENFGIPFCMTVEAEVLGSEINYGTLACEPKIQKEIYPDLQAVQYASLGAMANNSRVAAIMEAIHNLHQHHPDVPVIGSLTGPISTAASIVDPMTFLKQLRTQKPLSHQTLDYVTGHLIEYARLMVDNGADVISIADPTATGEILGPKTFEEYGLFYLNKLIDAIHALDTPVIVHICGQMKSILPQIAQLNSNAISADAFVSLRKIKQEIPQTLTMGNLSTLLLETGETNTIQRHAERLIRDKVDIIAPACGLSTSTPLNNVRAFTGTVREH